MKKGIQHKADFYQLRYSNCWEDADILCRALEPVARGGRLLSVASAGDNSLALLLLDPAAVVAVDLSLVQLACLELKMAAIRGLENYEVLRFLGVKESDRRLEQYRALAPTLSEESRIFWDKNPAMVEGGILHAGRLARYFARWRRVLHWTAHPKARVEELFRPKSANEQREFFHRTWNTWRWRAAYRWMHSERQMGRNGRDPAFYDHAPKDVVSGPLERTHQILESGSVADNPYLMLEMTGNFSSAALPAYLRPENMSQIRRRLDRMRLRRGGVEETADGPFHAMNLSNIFEYMDPSFFEKVYARLAAQLVPGGRMAYWNLHARREGSAVEGINMERLEEERSALQALDKVPAYRSFQLDARVD